MHNPKTKTQTMYPASRERTRPRAGEQKDLPTKGCILQQRRRQRTVTEDIGQGKSENRWNRQNPQNGQHDGNNKE